MKYRADTTLFVNEDVQSKLKANGWLFEEIYRSRPRGKSTKRTNIFGAYIREIKRPDCNTPQSCYSSDKRDSSLQCGLAAGANAAMGRHRDALPPTDATVVDAVDTTALALGNITSIARMRQDTRTLVVALDTEFYYHNNERYILCWQLAFIHPDRPDCLQEVIFCSSDGGRLGINFMLAWLIDRFDLDDCSIAPDGFNSFDFRESRRYYSHSHSKDGKVKTHTAKSAYAAAEKSDTDDERAILLNLAKHDHQAQPNSVNAYGEPCFDMLKPVDGYRNVFKDFNGFAFPITLVCHTGKADISALDFDGVDDIVPRLSEVQGGWVSMSPFYLHSAVVNQYWKFYPISVTVRATSCFAPAEHRCLANLGATINVPKLDVDDVDKDNMRNYLLREPVEFAEYAINDSVIALCYSAELWGYNKTMPITVSSAAVKAAVPVISDYLGAGNKDEFNKLYRGLTKVKKGLVEKKDKSGFIENSSLCPVSDKARILQDYARNAYKGGYNGSSIIGYFTENTYDYDLENAYPTCMSLVPDVDWDGAVIANEIVNREILIQDFHSPFDLMFGYVRFEFPDDVKYPCIPVAVDGSMIFPLSSKGLDGVYVSAPEIYLALCLGAKVIAEHVYVGAYRYTKDGQVSHSLFAAVKQLVNDRGLAKQTFGKKSLPDQLLKTAVNSLYGKTAQNLIEKSTWNAYVEQMQSLGCSALTSPTHACLTTSGVRCVLLAAMNQLADFGYDIYSVTTDGFITNAPENVLTSLDLYGFADLFKSARVALVNDPTMWSCKHHQNDLLNFTTRGNISLSLEGVCAHNSFVTGFAKDSYEDRLALMTAVLGRTDRVHTQNPSWSKFRALSARENRADFSVKTQERALSMDFDLKRKPIESSIMTVQPLIEDVCFEIANFETVPYGTVAEYEAYKSVGNSCKVLRTARDWQNFFGKLVCSGTGKSRHIKDFEWSALMTCVMGHRLGLWEIPFLSRKDLTLDDKLSWINSFNTSSKKFSLNNWKDCRKQARSAQMLERCAVADKLYAMQSFKS